MHRTPRSAPKSRCSNRITFSLMQRTSKIFVIPPITVIFSLDNIRGLVFSKHRLPLTAIWYNSKSYTRDFTPKLSFVPFPLKHSFEWYSVSRDYLWRFTGSYHGIVFRYTDFSLDCAYYFCKILLCLRLETGLW